MDSTKLVEALQIVANTSADELLRQVQYSEQTGQAASLLSIGEMTKMWESLLEAAQQTITDTLMELQD